MRDLALVEEHWPAVPGHGEQWQLWTADVKRVTDRHALVRPHRFGRLLRRWRWLPIDGTFVRVVAVTSRGGRDARRP